MSQPLEVGAPDSLSALCQAAPLDNKITKKNTKMWKKWPKMDLEKDTYTQDS